MNYDIRRLIARLLRLRRIDGQQLSPAQEWRIVCRGAWSTVTWESEEHMKQEIRRLFGLRHA